MILYYFLLLKNSSVFLVIYRQKRYLMCAGSILSQRHVLTSASCIHEATHIRYDSILIGSVSQGFKHKSI